MSAASIRRDIPVEHHPSGIIRQPLFRAGQRIRHHWRCATGLGGDVPMMAADSPHARVHLIVPSGVRFCCLPPCRCVCNAGTDSAYQALHFAPFSNVQTACSKRAWPAAIAAFVGVLPAHIAAPPPRRCRERKRPAKAEGKIEGRSTKVCAKRACTWGWRGTRHGRPCAAINVNALSALTNPRASFA